MKDEDFHHLNSHDQNFKNLAVDYPIQAIEFFAHSVYPKIEGNPKVTFLRQEQQKGGLSQHHRELDIPILLEWNDDEAETTPKTNSESGIAGSQGSQASTQASNNKSQASRRKNKANKPRQTSKKAIVIFAIEAESNPYKFDAVRLAQYSLDLAKQHKTSRVVPVVVFTAPGRFQKQLQLGTERVDIMQFNFVYCQLSQLNYQDWRDSNNIVARLTLPLMHYQPQEKLELVHKSLQGLTSLESDDRKQGKYIEFIEYYGKLTEQETSEFNKRYPKEGNTMSSYYHRLYQEKMQQERKNVVSYYQRLYQEKVQESREQGVQAGVETGIQVGIQKGQEQGQRLVLLRLMKKRFAQEFTAFYENKISSASLADIEQWADNILDAKTLDDVFA